MIQEAPVTFVPLVPEVVEGEERRFVFVLVTRDGELVERCPVPLMEALPDCLVWRERILFTLLTDDHDIDIEHVNLDDNEIAYVEALSFTVG